MESGTFADSAFDPHPTSHQQRQALADGQAESATAVLSRRRGVHLAEGLEEPIHPVGRDTNAGIPNGKVQLDRRGGFRNLVIPSLNCSMTGTEDHESVLVR